MVYWADVIPIFINLGERAQTELEGAVYVSVATDLILDESYELRTFLLKLDYSSKLKQNHLNTVIDCLFKILNYTIYLIGNFF